MSEVDERKKPASPLQVSEVLSMLGDAIPSELTSEEADILQVKKGQVVKTVREVLQTIAHVSLRREVS